MRIGWMILVVAVALVAGIVWLGARVVDECGSINLCIIQYQTLLTGFLAVVAAGVAFSGVVYTQRRVAENAEMDRQHFINAAQKEHDRRVFLLRQEKEHEGARQKSVFIHAVVGELSALWSSVDHQCTVAETLCAVVEAQSEQRQEWALTNLLPAIKTPVYDSHINSLGLLPPSLTHSIVWIYTKLHAREQIKERPIEERRAKISVALGVLRAQEKHLKQLRDEIHDVVMRLHAIRLGHDDPGLNNGTLFYDEYLRDDPLALANQKEMSTEGQ